MILYPAIDLKDGKCVRLYKGRMEQETVFNDSPSDQAIKFANDGCEWLHLVDLNGAFAGSPINSSPVEEILKSVDVPVQLGGGIRSLQTIESWLSKGLSRVILGTVAVEDPSLVKQAASEFPGKVAVGLDARNGMIATRGWAEETDINIIELAKKFEDVGISAIIYTDINRDGMKQSPNFEETAKVADVSNCPVIISGGVSSIDDIKNAKNLNKNIEGIIVGKAIYDGDIKLDELAREIDA